MKKLTFALSLIIISFCLSCSDENALLDLDDNYFPLEVDNSWNYNNELNQNLVITQGTEILTVDQQNQNRYTFSQTYEGVSGVFTSMLASGEVFKQNGDKKIIYEGNLILDLGNDFSIIEIPLEDFTLYEIDFSQDDIMASTTGEFQKEINGFPIDFFYEISSNHRGFVMEEFVNGLSYEDVFVSEIKVSLSAQVFIVFSDFTILEKQEITSITNYYAKDIGLIKSDVSTEIIFEDIPDQLGIEIPDVNFTSSQKLVSYTFNPNS